MDGETHKPEIRAGKKLINSSRRYDQERGAGTCLEYMSARSFVCTVPTNNVYVPTFRIYNVSVAEHVRLAHS